MNDHGWTDLRVDLLKTLWQAGLSASQIARQLGGVTRNAVIGKVHRLGLSRCGRAAPSRPRRIGAQAPRSPRSRRAAKPRRAAAAIAGPTVPTRRVTWCVETDPGLATLRTLGAHMCRWPIGDPLEDGFTFCGRPAERSYCGQHAQIAYRQGAAKPLDADPEIRRALAN